MRLLEMLGAFTGVITKACAESRVSNINVSLLDGFLFGQIIFNCWWFKTFVFSLFLMIMLACGTRFDAHKFPQVLWHYVLSNWVSLTLYYIICKYFLDFESCRSLQSLNCFIPKTLKTRGGCRNCGLVV